MTEKTNVQRLHESRDYWDQEAPTFDNEPDHGLLNPQVYAAWERLLATVLPTTPSRIFDIGCGTGSLSILLARSGHNVTGADLSPAMIVKALPISAHNIRVKNLSITPDLWGSDVTDERYLICADFS